jgi:hypothetical protein
MASNEIAKPIYAKDLEEIISNNAQSIVPIKLWIRGFGCC